MGIKDKDFEPIYQGDVVSHFIFALQALYPVPAKKPVNARLLTKDDVEQIRNTARQDAAPWLSLMSEIAARSEVKGYLIDNEFKIVWEFESNPTYLLAKKEVEDIFEKARKLIE